MKIGFIGVGNMAKAIIKGMLKADYNGNDILVHSAHAANYETFAKDNGLVAESDNSTLVKNSDIVVLAVKPQMVNDVLAEVQDKLSTDKLLVSLVSGLSVADMKELVGQDQPVLRTMPNVNVEIGQGMTAVVSDQALDAEPYLSGVEIFDKIGGSIEVAEKDFPAFSAIAGSAPAYAYLFVDALSRAGVKYGFKKDDATRIAAQVVKGSADMILKSDEIPYALIDKVSSPGGTTVAGLLAMEEAGLSTAVVKGIDATINKELGQ
ncbi:pyrroline-5-carboxylate reductase [Pediococcus argentinicus]|uniref:Pyrroline-5-carboxylate reductase n=1 Tax=Pediococcus argentinicus TaxID=480391 RepID=A0A0R2NB74_9LACO|nr:pyrroline-5-carboxylate reductase [Pediococcus argentinicus]KRO23076.1 proC protein [Pediococcus argentinicus]NKZ22940.1 pyrroline-5-carboxylate reductase [Pediococcus argentinicus]GEP20011.1 pyrroline-5-carboxylate reductase [Pediococcus argentinicus]